MLSLKLQTSDGQIFETDVEIWKCSRTIMAMLSFFVQSENESNNSNIKLETMDSNTLLRVLQWAEHYRNSQTDWDNNGVKELTDWDHVFFLASEGGLYELLNAALFLDIEGLATTTAKKIASLFVGKSVDETRALLNETF